MPETLQDGSIHHYLDELSEGGLSPDDFLREVMAQEAGDPEVTWEVLALLDQYFRRGKIAHDVFISLRARLQQHSLGCDNGVEIAPPPAASQVLQATATAMSASLPLQEDAHLDTRDAADFMPGDVLRGRYRLVERLPRTAAGPVFEAIDELKSDLPGVRPRVAIQMVEEAVARDNAFMRRVCRLQALSHPSIVRIFDVDQQGGTLFYTTEQPGGMLLRELLDHNSGQRLAASVALTMVRTIAGALAYAHSREVFHGDVSAENVFISDFGEVRLQGFSLGGGGRGANAAGDRLAFAWLAYTLLSGGHATDGSLRAPSGITGVQWRALRDTMNGRDTPRARNLLAEFAGAPVPVDRFTFLQAFGQAPRRRAALREWGAAAAVLALIAIGVFVLTSGSSGITAAIAAAVADEPEPSATLVPAATNGSSASSVAEPVNGSDTPVARAVDAAPVAAPTSALPPRATVDLPTDAIWVNGTLPVARIWVRRRGNLARAVSFEWWTETGSALVDRDFRQVLPRTAVIPPGEKGVELLVPLVPDAARVEPRTFYVKIDRSGGASLGARTLMQVAIVPAAGVAAGT